MLSCVQTTDRRPRAPSPAARQRSLLGAKCLQTQLLNMSEGRETPLKDTWTVLRPHLWSVLLELSALLDKPLSGLLAFILPVRQYCCGGIEFPLSRETQRKTRLSLLLRTRGDRICIRPEPGRGPPVALGVINSRAEEGLGPQRGVDTLGQLPSPRAHVPEHHAPPAQCAVGPHAPHK